VCTRRLKLARSSYYFSRSHKSLQDQKDLESLKSIREVFESRNGKVGVRQIHMLLERNQKITFNEKRIARIKNIFGLKTRIRKRSKYSSFKVADQEHRTLKNKLNRDFNPLGPDQVYSTDITELQYGKFGQKAYLAAFKDLATNEIVAMKMMRAALVDLATETLKSALRRIPIENRKSLLIHSDQGHQFTNYKFQKLIRDAGATQSMSRRGNCLDNAPIESFFGHLKDHLELKELSTFEEVEKHVTDEIEYYNRERPQEVLMKMPPASYRRHLRSLERAN
jgi:putative transposase